MNLDQVVDYSAAWTFTDAFKSSRDWFSLSYNTATGEESWSGGGTPVVDAKGWPVELQTFTNADGQLVQQRLATLMFREIGGNYPAGVYHAQWRGTGTIGFGFDATVVTSGTNPDGTRWADLNVTPTDAGIFVKINDMPPVDSDPTDAVPAAVDPIRGFHVWLPDYNGQSFEGQVWQPGASFSPFHPLFVERLSPFKTLRFMDWMKTNGSTNETWADRRMWDEANQTGEDNKGVAVEYLVALANEIGADVWVNMPYKAADDFVEGFAEYFRDNLDGNLDVNVEWSNEIWNFAGGFKTFGWITEQLALPENAGKSRYQFAAEQIRRDFAIWSDVFSDQPAGRLTRVVAGQAANPDGTLKATLDHMAGQFDAVSVTGYFGLSTAQRASFNASTTPEQVAQAVLNNVPSGIRGLQSADALGQQYGGGRYIKLYAYEAGQHADGQGNPNLSYLPALHAAQTHPLMYEAYDDFLRGFYEISGDLAVHYTYVSRNDKNGSWGALQSQAQPTPDAPKYRALVEAANGAGYVPEYTIAVEQAAGDEFGPAPVSFRFTRTGDKSLAQSVNFALGGTATASDYANPGSAIQFAAGQASALLTITPNNDAILEDAETIAVTLQPGGGYQVDGIAARTTATASIADDDGAVNVALPIANASFESGNLSGWTKVLPTPVSPTGATNVIDVAPPADGVTPPPINSPKVASDGAKFAWAGGAAGDSGNGALNQGIYQTFDLSSHAAAIDAGIARLAFTGWGAGWSSDYAQLEVRYFNGSTQVGATLTSNRGNVDKTWTKMTSDAAVPAGARSVQLRASMIRTGGAMTDAGVDQLAARFSYPIVPVVDITATDATASEPGTDTATFTVTRSGGLSMAEPLTVSYTVAGTAAGGTDYASLNGSVTIPAGSASATVTVSPADDIVDERDETVVLSLVGRAQYVLGTSVTATATIVDNDLPRVTIAATDDVAAEAGEDAATFVVERLTEVLDQPLTVRYSLDGTATNGSDFTTMNGTVTIPAGESVAAIALLPVDDTAVEKDETVVVTLSADATYTVAPPSTASATIVNDDFPRVTVTASDADASEVGPEGATFTFIRTGEFVNEDLTVHFAHGGTAALGEDYDVPADGVTIPTGQLSASVTITPLADDAVEGSETVVLTVAPGAGYTAGSPSSATATIADAPTTPGNLPPTVTAVFVSGSQWTANFRNHLAATGAGDAAFGFRVPLDAQLGILPWINLDRVSVRFSEAVDVQQADLVVRCATTAVHASSGFTYDPATFTATWTLAAPIANEKVLLDLDGDSRNAVTDLAGAALDGDWSTNRGGPASGNGTAGGNFLFRLNVLPGDANRSGGSVVGSDVTLVRNSQNFSAGTSGYSIFRDVNGSASILGSDVTAVRNRQGLSLPAGEPSAPDGSDSSGGSGGSVVITDPAESIHLPGDPS